MEQPFERLRHARKEAGFKSASAAARANGWNEAAYRHHENGTRGYGIDQAIAYGAAFSVSPSWLLTLGFSQNDSWRLPIGKFYVEALYAQLTWKPGLEETVNNAADLLNLRFVLELDVSVNTIDVVKGEDDYPLFHFVSPSVVGVVEDRFNSGYMFYMRAPKSMARLSVSAGDLLLVDSGEGEIRTKPELWVIRSYDELVVGWAQRQRDADVFLPDAPEASSVKIDPEANIIGRVRWIGHAA